MAERRLKQQYLTKKNLIVIDRYVYIYILEIKKGIVNPRFVGYIYIERERERVYIYASFFYQMLVLVSLASKFCLIGMYSLHTGMSSLSNMDNQYKIKLVFPSKKKKF